MALSDRLSPFVPLQGRNFSIGSALEAGREDRRRRELFNIDVQEFERQKTREEKVDEEAATTLRRTREQEDLDAREAELDRQLDSMIRGGLDILPNLGTPEGNQIAQQKAEQRAQEIVERGGDPTQTLEIRDLIASGQIDRAAQEINTLIDTAIQFGRIKPLGGDASVSPFQKGRGFVLHLLAQQQLEARIVLLLPVEYLV